MSAVPVPSVLRCTGCGYEAPERAGWLARCPRADALPEVDHVLAVRLDHARLTFPRGTEPNPFVRYRTLLRPYHLARAAGMSDEAFAALVADLDRAVAAVDGRGFVVTPCAVQPALGARLGFVPPGGVWVKDETGNVSGSHKARHLMGLWLYLEVARRAGGGGPPAGAGLEGAGGDGRPELAIASCGNAALAAAVVARAARWPLRVFVPTSADPVVVERLHRLEARVVPCAREPGAPGDPTYLALRRAVAAGSLPFTCQGSDNGLTIEGGKTLGYELADTLARAGVVPDRLFVQVGGGALASAVVQGLEDAVALGVLPRLPRVHAVQPAGVQPLRRAYDRVAARALDGLDRQRDGASGAPEDARGDRARADLLAAHPEAVEEALAYAVRHRRAFMWPWEETPRSVAHGIIDDETYDWAAVVRAMLVTGGWPVAATEADLREAHRLARETTGIPVDPTGSAGLAGLLRLRREGAVGPQEQVVVLFTGVERGR